MFYTYSVVPSATGNLALDSLVFKIRIHMPCIALLQYLYSTIVAQEHYFIHLIALTVQAAALIVCSLHDT